MLDTGRVERTGIEQVVTGWSQLFAKNFSDCQSSLA
jgi:hypothetical protein